MNDDADHKVRCVTVAARSGNPVARYQRDLEGCFLFSVLLFSRRQRMKLLATAAFGAATLATAFLGAAAPAEARSGVGIYVGGPGYDYDYRYRCDDYWYRRRHPRRCAYYYDYDDYDDYPSSYYYNDYGYYPGFGFTFYSDRDHRHRWSKYRRHRDGHRRRHRRH
jgi:hypothetical protein